MSGGGGRRKDPKETELKFVAGLEESEYYLIAGWSQKLICIQCGFGNTPKKNQNSVDDTRAGLERPAAGCC